MFNQENVQVLPKDKSLTKKNVSVANKEKCTQKEI